MLKLITKFFILGLTVFLACGISHADQIGKITALEGRVDVFRAGSSDAVPLVVGEAISTGDAVRTKSVAKAQILFNDNSTVRLAENTRIDIPEYTVGQDGSRVNAVINLERGEVRAIVSKNKGQTKFFVNTPNTKGSIKGSDIFVFYQHATTGILVKEGNFTAINTSLPDKAIEIPKDYITVVPADESPQTPRPYMDIERTRHEAQTTVVSLPAPSTENPSAMTASVVSLKGTARLREAGTITWRAIKLGDTIKTGDEIETKEDGFVEIRLENNNIIDLKPNTNLIFKTLSRDLKTGEYENLMESSLGKIRAKVQALKGNSKFEIKTPVAVASVRGTIMYLDIMPKLTKTYFQNGNGTLTNLISGLMKSIPDGQLSAADGQGGITNPTVATDSDRQGFEGGWGDNVYGYSTPEGSGSGNFGVGNTGPNNPDAPGGVDNPYVNVPPEDNDQGNEGTSSIGTIAGLLSNGYFGSYDSSDEDSSIKGSVTIPSALLSNPTGDGTLPVASLAGTYSNPGENTLWLADLSGTDTNGGAFSGWIGGSWHSWEGLISALYIDDKGNAGIIGSYITGPAADGAFSGKGGLRIEQLGQTDISPADINVDGAIKTSSSEGWIRGTFDENSGYINGNYVREEASISGALWGISRTFYSADYNNPNGAAQWSGVLGGSFGNNGYFISAVEGQDANNSVMIDILGASFLDYERLGIAYETLLGTYYSTDGGSVTGSSTLESVGLGTYVEAPVTFIGDWGQTETSLYNNNNGTFSSSPTGEERGLIGSSEPNWWAQASFPVIAMGKYYDDAESEPYVWNTPVNSDNGDTNETLDGGAFYGVTGGIWNAGIMNGALAAIYLAPIKTEEGVTYNAGVLRGDLSGKYYPDISMWMASGSLTPTEMAEGLTISPADLANNITPNDTLTAEINGDFGGEDFISGSSYSGSTYFINDESSGSQAWGIYDLKIGSENSYDNPQGSKIWTSEIEGSGLFGYRYSQGLMQGDVYGIYSNPDSDGYGNWIATSTGVWAAHGSTGDPTTESGSYYGFMDGVWYNNKMIGAMAAIYIQPFGDLSWDDVLGPRDEFSATGTGNFEDGKTITFSNASGDSRNLSNEDGSSIAIYETFLSGTYQKSSKDNWQAVLDNSTVNTDTGDIDKYSLTNINGTKWSDGLLEGLVSGTSLSYNTLGHGQGEVVGVYNSDGTWQAVGVGSQIDEPLTFSGTWGEDGSKIACLYNNNNGTIEHIGDEYGFVGSATPEWWSQDSFDMLAMGQYDIQTPSDSGRYIWNTRIQSYNTQEGNSTTLDGGAFYGYTSGIWNNGSMDGSVAAIYLSAGDGSYNAGLLRGNVAGNYYQDFSKWMLEGSLTQTKPIETGLTDITPAGLSGAIFADDISNYGLYGHFSDNVNYYIHGYQDQGHGYSIGQNVGWGIFDIMLGDGKNTYYNPSPGTITTWSAVMGGPGSGEGASYWISHIDGTWKDGEIRGTVTKGRSIADGSIATIEGDLYGVNSANGTWVGTDVQTYQETPLTLGASLDEGIGTNNDCGFGKWAPDPDHTGEHDIIFDRENASITGLLGSTEPLIDDTDMAIVLMGEFKNPTNYKLWALNAASGTYNEYNTDTAFKGLVGGADVNNVLKGAMQAFYIKPDGQGGYTAGYLLSTNLLSGNFYPDLVNSDSGLALFEGDGSVHATDMGPTTYSPDDLLNGKDVIVKDGDSISGGLAGDISGELKGEAFKIADQGDRGWGLVRMACGGDYDTTRALSDDWHALMGGGSEGDGQDNWICRVTRTSWANGILTATVEGKSLDPYFVSDIQGNMVGAYSSGNWEAVLLGEYGVGEELSSSGYMTAVFDQSGKNTNTATKGLIGLTGGIWGDGTKSDFVSLGDMKPNVPNEGEPAYTSFVTTKPFIWHTDHQEIYSYNPDKYNPDGTYNDTPNPTNTTYDGGAFYALAGGTGRDGKLEGKALAIYIDPNGNAGILEGWVSGDYAGVADTGVAGSGGGYIIEGTLTNTLMASGIEMSPADLVDNIDHGDLYAGIGEGASGDFTGNGFIDLTGSMGGSMSIPDQNWGVFGIEVTGNYSNPGSASSWKIAMGGDSLHWVNDQEAVYDNSNWVGTITGSEWSDGKLAGTWQGFYFRQDGTIIRAGTSNGDTIGNYVEVGEKQGTFDAISAGQWVEVTDLLSPDMFGPDGIKDLQSFVSVPITETYSSLLTGAGSFTGGGVMAGTMDISVYTNALGQLWTGLINGTYSGTTSSTWQLNLAKDGTTDSVTLNGSQWTEDGKWAASVTGTVNGKGMTGGAGGTYNDGKFTGIGAGLNPAQK